MHSWSRLVQPVVWRAPVQDPHLQEIVQDVVRHHLSIQRQKILMRSDHVGPQDVIMMKLKETVPSPPLLDHELVVTFFSRESNTIGASVEDLREVRILSTTTGFRFSDLLSTRVRFLPVGSCGLMIVSIPSSDAIMIQSRPLIDDTTGKRRSRRSRHFEDSMVEEELEESNGVRLRRLIRSYRSQDSFPRKPSITVSVTLHVTTFVIHLSSCFMITTYHAIVAQARDISRHHHTLCAANAVFFPMHSFPLMFHPFHFGLRGSPIQPL